MPPYPREMRMTAATPTSPSKPSGIKPQNRRLVRAGTQRVTVETKESAIGPVAVILPQPDSTPLTPSFVEQLTVSLRAAASTPIRIRTTAIGEDEAAAFRAAGFDVAQRLHLLVHDLGPPELAPRGQSAGLTIRGLQVGGPFGKARTLSLLAIDHAAFAPDMRLDLGDFANAMRATPVVRLRVAMLDAAMVGYAIFGRSGRRGYLQRLAVIPTAQGRGIGRALVVDGIRWCRRRRVARLVVNTEHGNTAALHLYRTLGFGDAPLGLVIMEHTPSGACA